MKGQDKDMKLIFCRTAALCTALSGLTLAGGALQAGVPGGADRREIQNDYRRFTAAETSGQYDRIKQVAASLLSPSFVLHTPSGKTLDYAQFLAEMKDGTKENSEVKENTFHPQTVTRQGDALAETGVYVFSRTALDVDGDFGAKGLSHSLSERTDYQSRWVKTGGHWRLRSLRFLGRTQIVDGKKHV